MFLADFKCLLYVGAALITLGVLQFIALHFFFQLFDLPLQLHVFTRSVQLVVLRRLNSHELAFKLLVFGLHTLVLLNGLVLARLGLRHLLGPDLDALIGHLHLLGSLRVLQLNGLHLVRESVKERGLLALLNLELLLLKLQFRNDALQVRCLLALLLDFVLALLDLAFSSKHLLLLLKELLLLRVDHPLQRPLLLLRLMLPVLRTLQLTPQLVQLLVALEQFLLEVLEGGQLFIQQLL